MTVPVNLSEAARAVAVIERTVFYVENGALEEAMRKLIEKRAREVQAQVA